MGTRVMLLLVIYWLLGGTLCLGPEFIKQTHFNGVDFSKITFFDNSSLFDDVNFLDRTYYNITNQNETESPPESVQPSPTTTTALPPVPDQLQVDVLLVADYSMYEKFMQIYPQSGDSAYFALRDYLRVMFDQKTRIFLKLSGTMPIFRAEDCPMQRVKDYSNITSWDYDNDNETFPDFSPVDALNSVHSIHDWLEEYQKLLPKYDHVIVFTRRDLLSQTNESATQGMAYVRAMCRGSDSVSVVEDVGGLTTVAIAAHEMAHSLGAFHDGSGNSSDCLGSHNFLMAPHTSGNELSERFQNSFLLSECSLQHIEEFLESEDSLCLRKEITTGPKRTVSPDFSPRNSFSDRKRRNKKAGELFDRTQQCKIAFGSNYGKCSRNDYHYWKVDPCRRLWCQDRSRRRYSTCETKAFLPVMDGTSCGLGKWCLRGDCVKNKNYFAEECVDIREDYCKRFTEEPRNHYCVNKSIQRICCRTCQLFGDPKRITVKERDKTRRLKIKTDL